MKKDYAVVPADEAGADETRYIADSWSERWASMAELPRVQAVPSRDEYRLMAPFLDRLPRGARLLDGGCGLGEWTVFLTDHGYDVTEIDLSVPTIERLRAARPAYRFAAGDIRATGLPDASFDGYFSWGTFEHFELGMEAPLREARRILRPGGLLFASVPFQNWRHILRDHGRLDRWDETYDRVRGYTEPQRFYQWRFTQQEFRRELELRGFRVLTVVPMGKVHGVNRWLQHDAKLLGRSRLAAAVARRVFSRVLPTGYVAHLIWAAAERRA